MRKISWRLLLGLLLLFAQTPVALAQPPPGYPRAPHPPGLVPKAPGDIPLQKIKLPPGFQIELWAHGISNPRSLTLGDKVAVFVGTRDAGNVYAVLDQGGTRKVITIANDTGNMRTLLAPLSRRISRVSPTIFRVSGSEFSARREAPQGVEKHPCWGRLIKKVQMQGGDSSAGFARPA